MVALDVLVPRIAARSYDSAAAYEFGYADLSRPQPLHLIALWLGYLRSPWSSGQPETAAVGSAWPSRIPWPGQSVFNLPVSRRPGGVRVAIT